MKQVSITEIKTRFVRSIDRVWLDSSNFSIKRRINRLFPEIMSISKCDA